MRIGKHKIKLRDKLYRRLKYISDNSDAIKDINQLIEAILNRYINEYVYNWSKKKYNNIVLQKKDKSINKIINHKSVDIDYGNNRLKPLFSNVSVSLYTINNDFFLISKDYILFYSYSRFITVSEVMTVLDKFNIKYNKEDLTLNFGLRYYYYETFIKIENKEVA